MKFTLITLIFVIQLACSGTVTGESMQSEPDQPKTDPSFNDRLEEAVEEFYQTRWGNAQSMFDKLKEDYPDDPRPYFFESMMPFWEYFFVHQKKQLADDFLDRSEKAVELSEQRLDENPGDTTTVFLLSGLYGYRSLVAASEKNYRVAMQSGVTGFGYTRKLLSIDSDRPDARIGRGMFYYMVGSVPKEVRWVTNVLGVRGDVEQGFRELEKAAESESTVRYDAMMMLMYLHEKEENIAEALKYASQLTDRFNENVIFLYKEAELNDKLGNKDKAARAYKKVIDKNNKHLKDITEISKKRVDELYALGLIEE
ncbi:MAG: tetratricopeptide repeat protein [Balneolaceae bacterium]